MYTYICLIFIYHTWNLWDSHGTFPCSTGNTCSIQVHVPFLCCFDGVYPFLGKRQVTYQTKKHPSLARHATFLDDPLGWFSKWLEPRLKLTLTYPIYVHPLDGLEEPVTKLSILVKGSLLGRSSQFVG